jgi:hypothetical protein
MSLHDRYNRGGGRLENLDRYLTHLGNRAGNAWHDRTGVSRHVLTQGLTLFAIWAALQNFMISRNLLMVVIAGLAFLGLRGMTQSRGGLVEQIQVEALGLPRWTFALLRLMLLTVGSLALARATGGLALALQTGTPVPFEACEALLKGAALVSLQAGDYIRRTNPPTASSNGHGVGV